MLAGRALPVPPEYLLWPCGGLFLAALASHRARSSIPALITSALVMSLGALLFSAQIRRTGADDPSRYISPDTVTLHGTVFEAARGTSRSVRLLVDCDSVVIDRVGRKLAGRMLVILTGRAAEPSSAGPLVPGRTIAVRAPIRGMEPARNPGEIDWRTHYLFAGIRARMSVRSPGQVAPGAESRDGFLNRFVVPVRRELSARLRSMTGDREARFLNGLILGERSEVPPDLKADFITVGVMHLLAISGQQVVLVAMLLAALLRMLRVPEKPRFVALACALVYYVLLTGGSPSVTRAGIMAIVMLGGGVAQRRPDIFNALGVSALVILTADPAQLFDPGFLLSYAAVLAIVLLYPLLISLAPGVGVRLTRVRLFDLAWKGAAVSLSAGLGTVPITAFFFGRVSLSGFVANLLIVPLSSAALVLGMLAIGASYLGPWIGQVYAAPAGASAWLTFRLVELFADLPYAAVSFRLSTGVLCAIYGLLGLGLASAARKTWKPLLFGALFLADMLVYAGAFSARPGNVLRVTFLDVGQGDAALIEFPRGGTMLIDGGPKTFSFDAGRRTILPFLRHMGVDTLDYVVLSHPHGDHLGGLPAVIGSIPVGTIIEGRSAGTSALYQEFMRLSDSLGIPRQVVHAGESIGRGLPVRIFVLGPEAAGAEGGDNLNDRSVVLLMRYGATTVLFPGDAEEGSERAIAGRYGGFLDADILKAGHHGSKTSSTGEFLRLVSPAWTVVSAGEGNSFGHPSPAILDRLAGMGSATHRTDLSGAAVFESDGRSWRPVGRSEWP